MSVSRYLRLVMLAIIDMMCTTPLGVYSIYIGNKGVKLAPWVSWEETHYNFSYVGRIPALVWRSDRSFRTSVELSRWIPVICALLFFILFGFASEARKSYQTAFWAVLKVFGVRPEKPVLRGLACVSPLFFTYSHLISHVTEHGKNCRNHPFCLQKPPTHLSLSTLSSD